MSRKISIRLNWDDGPSDKFAIIGIYSGVMTSGAMALMAIGWFLNKR